MIEASNMTEQCEAEHACKLASYLGRGHSNSVVSATATVSEWSEGCNVSWSSLTSETSDQLQQLGRCPLLSSQATRRSKLRIAQTFFKLLRVTTFIGWVRSGWLHYLQARGSSHDSWRLLPLYDGVNLFRASWTSGRTRACCCWEVQMGISAGEFMIPSLFIFNSSNLLKFNATLQQHSHFITWADSSYLLITIV
jgi:hypothetical protein